MKFSRNNTITLALAIIIVALSVYIALETLGIIGSNYVVRRIDLNAPEYSISVSPKLTLEYSSSGLVVVVSVSNSGSQRISVDEIKEVKVCVDSRCATTSYDTPVNLPIDIKSGETISFPLAIDLGKAYRRIGSSFRNVSKILITMNIVVNGYDNIVNINYTPYIVGKALPSTGYELWISKVEFFYVNRSDGLYDLYMNIYVNNIGTTVLYLRALNINSIKTTFALNNTEILPLDFWSYTFKLGSYNMAEIQRLKEIIGTITIEYSSFNTSPKIVYYHVKSGDWRP